MKITVSFTVEVSGTSLFPVALLVITKAILSAIQ